MGNIRQGDVWFVEAAPVPGGGTVGNEIWSGRPAVIVSNDGINERSNVVQVIYLTSPNKQRRTNTINPTVHVNSRESIAVCNLNGPSFWLSFRWKEHDSNRELLTNGWVMWEKQPDQTRLQTTYVEINGSIPQ